MCEVGIWSTS